METVSLSTPNSTRFCTRGQTFGEPRCTVPTNHAWNVRKRLKVLTSRKLSLQKDDHLYLIHGNRRGYAIFGCRCELCEEAKLAAKLDPKSKPRSRMYSDRAVLEGYLRDLRTVGESKSESHYNRRCTQCNRKCVPVDTFKKSQFIVPVTKTRAGREICEECQGNVPYRIGFREPCVSCGKPMRPRNSAPTDPPTVVHGKSGLCRTCKRTGGRK